LVRVVRVMSPLRAIVTGEAPADSRAEPGTRMRRASLGAPRDEFRRMLATPSTDLSGGLQANVAETAGDSLANRLPRAAHPAPRVTQGGTLLGRRPAAIPNHDDGETRRAPPLPSNTRRLTHGGPLLLLQAAPIPSAPSPRRGRRPVPWMAEEERSHRNAPPASGEGGGVTIETSFERMRAHHRGRAHFCCKLSHEPRSHTRSSTTLPDGAPRLGSRPSGPPDVAWSSTGQNTGETLTRQRSFHGLRRAFLSGSETHLSRAGSRRGVVETRGMAIVSRPCPGGTRRDAQASPTSRRRPSAFNGCGIPPAFAR